MTSPMALPELKPGNVVAQRFRLERKLGQGGMGSVWAAHHLTLKVEVALKFIETTSGAQEELQSRFAQEAMAVAKIKSPHVVSILDYGTDLGGRPYIAMELLQGEELAAHLTRVLTMSLRDVHRVVTEACRGLGRAHAAGVIHRDLKPENIFLCEDDEGFLVKILDFGIAKADSPIGQVAHRTGTGQLLGTPLYMSPEQALSRPTITFASDLYSLAVVAFRCLTSTTPFDAQGLGELIVQIGTYPPPSVCEKRPDLPPAVDAWFQRALSKEPGQRFASAKEMAETFSAACAVDGTAVSWLPGEISASHLTRLELLGRNADGSRLGGTLFSTVAAAPPSKRRARFRWVLVGMAIGLLSSSAVAVLTLRREGRWRGNWATAARGLFRESPGRAPITDHKPLPSVSLSVGSSVTPLVFPAPSSLTPLIALVPSGSVAAPEPPLGGGGDSSGNGKKSGKSVNPSPMGRPSRHVTPPETQKTDYGL